MAFDIHVHLYKITVPYKHMTVSQLIFTPGRLYSKLYGFLKIKLT